MSESSENYLLTGPALNPCANRFPQRAIFNLLAANELIRRLLEICLPLIGEEHVIELICLKK